MSLLEIAGYPLLLMSLAILPGIIYVTLYYRWDTHKKEPFEIVLKSFLWGAATVIPIGLLQSILPGENMQSLAPAYLIYMIVVVGFTEELCKWLVVRFYSTRQIAFDEVTDGVVYGACAGGGFAVFENIFYVMENGWEVAIIRASLSVPGHIIWGSISGYWIGMYKFAHVPKSTMLIKGLVFSAFAHGLFNTSLSYGMTIWFAPVFVVFPGILARRNLKNALAYDMQYIHSIQKITESTDTMEEKDGKLVYSHEESTVLNPNPILKRLVSLLFRFIGVMFILTAAFLTLGFWELIHKEAEKGYSYNDMWIPAVTAMIGILFYIKGFKVKKINSFTSMKKSSLNVMKGVDGVTNVNPNLKNRVFRNKTSDLSIQDFKNGILANDRLILSKAITLSESNLEKHHLLSQKILEEIIPFTGKSTRIGITGVPGVGKSTFIESFGEYIISQGHKLAVLAIDPTSQRTYGSILGDKTRMESLSKNSNAYIRPSPSSGSLGGVARKTRESIFLCEAAGYDVILIETVGVGQSETAVHSMVDFFLLLMLAGAGDELQGIKRGIMEMADIIAINKADGDNKIKSTSAQAEYKSALHLFPPTKSGWIPDVLTCSSTENLGIQEIWEKIQEYFSMTSTNGYLIQNRKEQSRYWFREFLLEAIQSEFYKKPGIREKAKKLEEKVVSGESTAILAIRELFSN